MTHDSVGVSIALRMASMPCLRATASTVRPTDGEEAEVVVRVQVIDRDAGVAHARDLRVELALERRAASIGRFIQARDEVGRRARESAPPSVSSDGTRAGSAIGPRPDQREVHAHAQRPAPRPAIARASSRSPQLPRSEVLVTMPSRCARTMPREIAGRHSEVVGVDDQANLGSGIQAVRICPERIRASGKSMWTMSRRTLAN